MSTLTKSIEISAPVEAVFAYALDIGKVWSSFAEAAVHDVDLKPDGVGTSATIYSHFLGFHIEGKVEYTEVVPNEKIVAKVHFTAEKPTWTFTFAPAEMGTTLTATGEWHVGIPAVGGTIEGMMAKEHVEPLEEWLATIKAGVENKAAA